MPIYVSDAEGLIEAIDDANNDVNNVYEIELQADIDLDTVEGDLFGDVGTPVVVGQVIIDGAGYRVQRTSGQIRLFSVDAKSGPTNASLTLKNMHLHDGDAGSSGSGAIVNDGFLSLENCTISNCRGATNGGAIYNGDGCNMVVNNCAFVDNYATGSNGRGGAIYNSSGSTLEMNNTIFFNNSLPGSGGRGGAIYQYTSGSDILLYDCSFVQNSADAGANIYSDGTLALVAVRAWWNDVTGPNGLDGVSGYTIITTPYRPTLPRFLPIPGTPTNPCLPPASAYTIQIQTDPDPGANARRGPSLDDACITTYGSGGFCNDLAEDLDTFPLLAYATDEENFMWYGFEHSARPNYLSWVREDVASVTPSPPFSGVPDFETQSDNTWGDILQISGDVLDRDFGSNRFRGFGNGVGLQTVYAAIADCSHPGLDFFPVTSGNVKVKAVADGIVVGIGLSGDGRRATLWGAVPSGGCNLIIRTGGHFVLYGELESVEPHLYLGARVFTGEIIATLADLGGNTHLHLEVDAYSSGQTTGCQLRQKFGAVIHEAGTENPAFLIDPMYYISNKGSFVSTTGPIDNSSCAHTLKTNYNLSSYDGASINAKSFDYSVRTDTYLQGFHRDNGTTHDPTTCVTAQPGACP